MKISTTIFLKVTEIKVFTFTDQITEPLEGKINLTLVIILCKCIRKHINKNEIFNLSKRMKIRQRLCIFIL